MTRSHPRIGPLAATGERAPALDVDALLDDPGTGIIVLAKDFGRTNWVAIVSSTIVGSSTTMLMTIWTGNTFVTAGTSAYAVPAGYKLRIYGVNLAAQSSAVITGQQFGVIVATATASLSVVATVGVAAAVVYQAAAASNIGFGPLHADISCGTTLCPAVLAGTSHTILGAVLQGYLYFG